MEISPWILWNGLITLVYIPIITSLRSTSQEIKRVDILLNKTREELPTKYVTKYELHQDMERIFDRFDKIDEKIDKLLNL
tara:strand:+ start:2648 stop:2887 length:240 start_codon:yes stop_codon:yes gene_type:complete